MLFPAGDNGDDGADEVNMSKLDMVKKQLDSIVLVSGVVVVFTVVYVL